MSRSEYRPMRIVEVGVGRVRVRGVKWREGREGVRASRCGVKRMVGREGSLFELVAVVEEVAEGMGPLLVVAARERVMLGRLFSVVVVVMVVVAARVSGCDGCSAPLLSVSLVFVASGTSPLRAVTVEGLLGDVAAG